MNSQEKCEGKEDPDNKSISNSQSLGREEDLSESEVNPINEMESSCCDPRKSYYRFIGLFFMCFLSFGSYYCYDTPGALQDQIKKDMDVTTFQFSLLYSLYSWPNVVLCFLGGFLIDRVFGICAGTLIFSSITTVGQVVYGFGAIVNQYWIMQLGRFVFGIGGESLAVAQNAYTVSWFKGKELNTVFGLLLSMARIGSTLTFLSIGPIYTWVDTFADGHVALGITLLIASSTCVLSLLCATFLGILNRRRAHVLKLDGPSVAEKVQLKDVLYFPATFWLICVICVTYYVAIFPFIGLAKVFFMRKYDMSESSANGVSSIIYVISAVTSPLFGGIVDKTGRNVFWVFLAILVTAFSHGLLAFTFINPFIPMCILGLGYSLLASSLWPMIAYILPESKLGTAYGLMQSIQNLGLALISMIGGYIVDTKGYLILEVFYLMWLYLALLSSVLIWGLDKSKGGILNLSSKDRHRRELLTSSTEDHGDDRRELLTSSTEDHGDDRQPLLAS